MSDTSLNAKYGIEVFSSKCFCQCFVVLQLFLPVSFRMKGIPKTSMYKWALKWLSDLKEISLDTRSEVEQVFSGSWISGLWQVIPEFLICSKYWTTKYFLPKMAPRLVQHLLRTKSKVENLELVVLYPCCFLFAVWLHHERLFDYY